MPSFRARGFTLIELLVVVSLIALGTAGVSLAMRDGNATRLEREGQRLAALLEAARAQSRASGVAVRWRPQGTGFVFEGLPGAPLPTTWLETDTQSVTVDAVLLGPDPIVAPARIHLSQNSAATGQASPRVQVVTDGLRPFRVEVGE